MGDDIQDAIDLLRSFGHDRLAAAVAKLRGEQQALCAAFGQAQQAAQDRAVEATRRAFCKLQRYSFRLDSRGNVRRVPEFSGNWVEFQQAHELFDPVVVDASLAVLTTEEAIGRAKEHHQPGDSVKGE